MSPVSTEEPAEKVTTFGLDMKNRVGPWLVLGAVIAGLSLFFALRKQPVAPTDIPASPPPAVDKASEAAVALRKNNWATVASNDPRAAKVLIAGREYQVLPNARGEYLRLVVAPEAIIEFSVPFPGAQPGEAIRVQSEDGGVLLDDAADGQVTVNTQNRANVSFSASSGDGLQRVTLRRGGERRVLEFWVGEEPPVLVRR